MKSPHWPNTLSILALGVFCILAAGSMDDTSTSSTNKPRKSFTEIQQDAKNDCDITPEMNASHEDCISIKIGNELYLDNISHKIVPPSCVPLTGMAEAECEVCAEYQPCVAAKERQQQNFDTQRLNDQINHHDEIEKQAEQDRLRSEGLIH
jgi:hypothetical protein